MLVDSFQQTNENDMEELVCSIYDEDYWEQLVKEATV
jgi:hypothetical protein